MSESGLSEQANAKIILSKTVSSHESSEKDVTTSDGNTNTDILQQALKNSGLSGKESQDRNGILFNVVSYIVFVSCLRESNVVVIRIPPFITNSY